MKRWMRWLLIAVGVVAVVLLLRATVFRPPPIEVETAVAERGVVEDVVTNSQAGTVRARHRSRLGAERAGRVIAIPHREGESVKRGEPLVRLDASTAGNQLDLARRELDVQHANVESARASLALAQRQYERMTELSRQNLVSQGDMDQARTSFDEATAALAAALAAVQRAEANVRLAQDDLAHMQVLAPFAGKIAQRLVEVGESVVPGQPVIELVAPDSLYVSAPIDEVDIGRIRKGLPARVTLDPYRGQTWTGHVSSVFPVVDDRLEQNRTLTVEVDIDRAPDRPQPLPGTSADIVIVLDQHDDVLRIPTFAVIEGQRVLVDEHGRAVSRDVKTGLRNWEWTEILGGLKQGEVVITSLDKQGVKAGVAVKGHPRETTARSAPAS
jgi:HlyD family secretion protein